MYCGRKFMQFSMFTLSNAHRHRHKHTFTCNHHTWLKFKKKSSVKLYAPPFNRSLYRFSYPCFGNKIILLYVWPHWERRDGKKIQWGLICAEGLLVVMRFSAVSLITREVHVQVWELISLVIWFVLFLHVYSCFEPPSSSVDPHTPSLSHNSHYSIIIA
jgi:hypothetical protein